MSNYFKEFFFEATISVNVTAMLVLTTMFINVSNNLPKTNYIQMIDVWLLVSLVKPFLDILLQTYIDNLRQDDKREINHHGKPRKVGQDKTKESDEKRKEVINMEDINIDLISNYIFRHGLQMVQKREITE